MIAIKGIDGAYGSEYRKPANGGHAAGWVSIRRDFRSLHQDFVSPQW